MNRRISVRLPDELVAWMDEQVASGAARNRSEVIARVLERDRRRCLAERDAEILARSGEDPDMRNLVEYMSRRPFGDID